MSNIKKRGRPSSYEAYSRDYDALQKEMNKRGYSMAERKYTEEEWKRAHYAVTNDRKREIAMGKRKTVGNVNRDLIKEQQWTYSTAQARAQKKAYKLGGGKGNIKISDIKGGKVQAVDWNAISIREQELRKQGWGWGRVHDQISEEFFGS